MAIWSDSYLAHLYQEAEEHISKDLKCIFDRFSLEIIANQAVYELPDDVVGIHRITWKSGLPVLPADVRELENTFIFRPHDKTGNFTGRPTTYLRLGYGFGAIRFFPTPNENISADDTGIWGPDIKNRVILSVYRRPNGVSDKHIPSYILRRTAKYFVLKEAYAKEGKGQDLNAAAFYEKKYNFAIQRFARINEKIPQAVIKQLNSQQPGVRVTIPHPVLPSNFGSVAE